MHQPVNFYNSELILSKLIPKTDFIKNKKTASIMKRLKL